MLVGPEELYHMNAIGPYNGAKVLLDIWIISLKDDDLQITVHFRAMKLISYLRFGV